jgi:hypothetical protein
MRAIRYACEEGNRQAQVREMLEGNKLGIDLELSETLKYNLEMLGEVMAKRQVPIFEQQTSIYSSESPRSTALQCGCPLARRQRLGTACLDAKPLSEKV